MSGFIARAFMRTTIVILLSTGHVFADNDLPFPSDVTNDRWMEGSNPIVKSVSGNSVFMDICWYGHDGVALFLAPSNEVEPHAREIVVASTADRSVTTYFRVLGVEPTGDQGYRQVSLKPIEPQYNDVDNVTFFKETANYDLFFLYLLPTGSPELIDAYVFEGASEAYQDC